MQSISADEMLQVRDALYEILCEISVLQEAAGRRVNQWSELERNGAQLILGRNAERIEHACKIIDVMLQTRRASANS